MKNNNETGLDFIIDKLTNSIKNVLTDDSFATDISILQRNDSVPAGFSPVNS